VLWEMEQHGLCR